MYKLLAGGELIERMSDGAVVPADPRNADYREFLDWEAKGNEPLPADKVEPPLPPEIEGLPPEVRARIEGFRAMAPLQLVDYVEKTAVDFDTLKGVAKDLALALSLVAGRVHLRGQ